MGKGYTELFFLDEVSALAAGHRPCFECQRKRAAHFTAIWESCFGNIIGSKADAIDRRLHDERTTDEKWFVKVGQFSLPDGAMFKQESRVFAHRNGTVLEWSGNGYIRATPLKGEFQMLTPKSILAVLAAGYQPDWHNSCPATGT